MMAGHALLKVIACFTWKAGAATGVIAGLAHGVTFVLLTILIGLELGVAVVQSGVISILLAIYINDAYNIH
jgi:F-type H+-transporting ATPase subunit a